MARILFRELKPYTLSQIVRTLAVNQEKAQEIVKNLLTRGIMRRRDTVIDSEVDEEGSVRSNAVWQFCYVGIVIVGEFVIVVYPKYFCDRKPDDVELRQILRVIRNLPQTMQMATHSINSNKTNDRLSLMLGLLDHYAEYGIYENYIDTRELNGRGVIDWNRTVNEHLPMLTEDGPVYTEFESRKTENDVADFITRLHRAVLTECSQCLKEWNLIDLLSIDDILLSDEIVDEFGELDTLVRRLDRERAIQFVTWKQGVLDLLDRYLRKRDLDVDLTNISCLGTTSFYHVWELACKVAFEDKLYTELGALGLRLNEPWLNNRKKKLIEIIPSPKWEYAAGEEFVACNNAGTLIPDTITIRYRDDGAAIFCIYDAKYYTPTVSASMKGQPGIESVTKQFLYQSAYRDFVVDHDFREVINAFLIPTTSKKVNKIARVSFPNVIADEKLPFSNYTDMWGLPATEVFSAYLKGKRIDKRDFRGVWDASSYDQANIIT